MQSLDDHRGERMAGGEWDDLEARISRSIDAYHEAALVYAAVKLGLPDSLALEVATASELAKTLGLSAPYLARFLGGLCSIGICEELPGGAFALTRGGRALCSGAPSRLAEKVQIVVGQYWWPWANFQSNLTTGKPAFEQCFGMRVSDWRVKHAGQGALFDAFLAKETLAQAGPIVDALDLSGAKVVADIGGGYGGLLAALLKAHPQIEGILLDRPHILAAAKPFLQAQEVVERVRLETGDLLTKIAVAANIYLLKGVLQQWDDAETRTILENCRKAMSPSAKLMIIERLMPERADDDPAAIMLDLHMMTISGGRARSLAEFETLLSQTRLKQAKATSTLLGLTIIEAVPA